MNSVTVGVTLDNIYIYFFSNSITFKVIAMNLMGMSNYANCGDLLFNN